MKTVLINDIQKLYYQEKEIERMEHYYKLYSEMIKEMKKRNKLRLLDIGGGGGEFARYIEKQLKVSNEQLKLEIVVIDTVKYDMWDIVDENIEYILCDAVDINRKFENDSFDYIFCNMFVHHLIGNSYKDSFVIRKNVFKAIKNVLKKDGKLLITDNFNNGIIFDSVSCRIIFTLTTCHNSVLKKIVFRLGAKSAGNGVCMMSERMWNDLLESTGFGIIRKKISEADKWPLMKKVILLNKTYKQNCFIVATKI